MASAAQAGADNAQPDGAAGARCGGAQPSPRGGQGYLFNEVSSCAHPPISETFPTKVPTNDCAIVILRGCPRPFSLLMTKKSSANCWPASFNWKAIIYSRRLT